MPSDRQTLDPRPPVPELALGRRPEVVLIELLGGFQVTVGSRVVSEEAWRLRKAAGLIKLLALAPGHRLHKEQAMDLLWPDLTPKAAANNLHRALYAARRTLEPDPSGGPRYLRLRDEQLALCPEGVLRVDVEAFEEEATAARRAREPAAYRAAIDLYTSGLLPDDRHEDWSEIRRARLRKLHLELLVELGGLYEESEEFGAGIEAFRGAVAEEPANEDAHAGLMRLYALSGRREEAMRQYEKLERELGGRPSETVRRAYEDIGVGRFPQGLPRGRPPGAGRHNLPGAQSSFVGRGREVVEVRRSLAMTALVTLTGAGGSGKTRLALEAARGLVRAYPDGVWLVELARVSEEDLVARSVAETVGAREEPGRSLEAVIVETLQNKKTLLLLDNCEHLVGAVAGLVEALVPTCPGLKVLATSREVLNVAGETVWRVPPLSMPVKRPSVREMERSEAAMFFVDRATPGFALTPENARDVASICRRLDGIPLAIELAAARAGAMSPGEISGRLGDSLGLLTTGDRRAETRQRTLRGALDWSHDLLHDDERALLRRLSVFAGGFVLEAAEAVGGDEVEVLDLLANLVAKSLVVAEVPLRARYRLLEPIRQYASEKLDDAGEGEAVRRAHGDFFLGLAERAEPELVGAGQQEWLERLELDHDNLRAAMGWYAGQGETEALLRMSGALWWFWCLRGYYGEGRGWLERALATGDAGQPAVRAKALTAAGDLAFLQSEYDLAGQRLEESLALCRTLGDKRGTASAVQLLGSIEREQGRYARAVVLHGQSLALWRTLGDDWGVAQSLNYLGFVAWLRQDYDRAAGLCARSLGMFRALGDGEGIAWSLTMLGATALYGENRDRAAALLEEGLALSRRGGYREGVAWALNELGILARREDRTGRAETLLRESLETHRDLGDKWRTASLLEGLAGTAGRLGRFRRAAVLFGAAEALREDLSDPVPPCERADQKSDVTAVRAGMEEGSFRAAWAAGRAMTLERAYEYALSQEKPDQETGGPSPESPALTGREREIAGLISQGLTNRRVAESLSISGRTVDTHVGRILKKLGLESRRQVEDYLKSRPREGESG